MILGQLYYYQKKVEEFSDKLSAGLVSDIEIFSLPQVDSATFAGMGSHEIARTLKDMFSSFYLKALKENKLSFAVDFWGWLTSPLVDSKVALLPRTDYQRELVEWMKKGSSFDDFDALLLDGSLTTEEEDYACFYGLSVLRALTLFEPSAAESLLEEASISKIKESVKCSDKPQILVFCDNYVAPLFKNLNCEFAFISHDHEVNLKVAEEKIASNPSLSLVLLVGKDVAESLTLLQRKLSNELLVSALNLNEETGDVKDTFFDRLVKETLGVRLT